MLFEFCFEQQYSKRKVVAKMQWLSKKFLWQETAAKKERQCLYVLTLTIKGSILLFQAMQLLVSYSLFLEKYKCIQFGKKIRTIFGQDLVLRTYNYIVQLLHTWLLGKSNVFCKKSANLKGYFATNYALPNPLLYFPVVIFQCQDLPKLSKPW